MRRSSGNAYRCAYQRLAVLSARKCWFSPSSDRKSHRIANFRRVARRKLNLPMQCVHDRDYDTSNAFHRQHFLQSIFVATAIRGAAVALSDKQHFYVLAPAVYFCLAISTIYRSAEHSPW
jgi:hypothetical protein